MASEIRIEDVSFWRMLQGTDAESAAGAGSKKRHKKYVCNSLNLHVYDGERVGLVGANGAGKTTLLRLMAGIFQPDSGTVKITGNVSSVLDAGFGLDPDLSGKSNCISRFLMDGVPKAEIANSVSKVEEFAELYEYFEQPIRTYSSGMLTRLVFSIGIVSNQEILIVDEGFGLADEQFQHKAQSYLSDRMHRASILVLASHNLGLLREHCSRGVLMEQGEIVFDGPIEETINRYLEIESGKD
jgi:lipopolysaccharide transport system ATP-binding protein